MSDDFIDKEEQNEENIPTPENGHSDYKPTDTKNTGVKHQLSGMYQNWFLDYASYVILERAVPHINDGLKPVQRRILHSMKRLDDGRYNKVANIVGHTMQFHPHGDASIGDALVQLGQKDLLIDCQGNWGNILTGDGAAAPRYIEARLSKFALDVVFNPKTTEWQASYDGRNRSPYLSNSRSCSLRGSILWAFLKFPPGRGEEFSISRQEALLMYPALQR